MKSFVFASALACVVAIAAAAPTSVDFAVRAVAVDTTGLDFYKSLNQTKGFIVLKKAVDAANLAQILAGLTNSTVLAPTNQAFANTLKDLGFKAVAVGNTDRIFNLTAGFLTEAKVDLAKLLRYHVLTANKTVDELNAMGNLTTLDNTPLKIMNGTFEDAAENFTNAEISTKRSLQTAGGVIYEINRVLLNVQTPNKTALAAIVAKVEKANPDTGSDPVCFPASSIVHTADGQDITMADLAAGHAVKVSESSRFSPVFLFTHKQHQGLQNFVRVTAVTGHSITLTPSHYMYANGKLVAARAVKVGDKIRTVKGPATVKSVENVKDFGLVAPHTMHGDIVVNGVVASTYTTAVHPRLAHLLLGPVRALVHMGISKEPLGSALYNGASRFSKIVPSGPDMF